MFWKIWSTAETPVAGWWPGCGFKAQDTDGPYHSVSGKHRARVVGATMHRPPTAALAHHELTHRREPGPKTHGTGWG